MAESFKWQSPFIQTVISLVIAGANENLFYNKTVKELVWGYKDNLLSEGQAIDKKWFYTDIAGYFAGVGTLYMTVPIATLIKCSDGVQFSISNPTGDCSDGFVKAMHSLDLLCFLQHQNPSRQSRYIGRNCNKGTN